MASKAVLSFLALIVLGGCLSEAPVNDLSSGPAFPMVVEDASGYNVTLAEPPMRIVSLAPSNTEILFALGLGDNVIGVTEYDNYPEEAQFKERIGGFQTVNIEKVVDLESDLILATGGVQIDVVERLRELGQTVVVLDAKGLPGIMENILLVGKITGRVKEAEEVVDQMRGRVDTAQKQAALKTGRSRIMYIVWGDPLMVAGPGAFAGDLIELSGGENIYADGATEYPTVSLESVIERDPEIIITSDHSGVDLSSLKASPGWMEIGAVENNRFYVIDADVVSRPGPRIVDALEQFVEWIGDEGV